MRPPSIVYIGFWSFSIRFCAVIPMESVELDMVSPSSTTYQAPRFWLKLLAPSNMPLMSVTPETSQSERSPLKEVALSNMVFM